MISIAVDEEAFIGYLEQWRIIGRNLVTLPVITQDKLELKLSVVSIDNTKHVSLNKVFYTYENIMSYYGQLIDRLNDE
jgi:hypothetical protein